MLGKLIVSELNGEDAARNAESSFENITINKNTPEEIQIFTIDKTEEVHLPKILTDLLRIFLLILGFCWEPPETLKI